MTVKIQSASDSLGLVSVNGGVRFVVRGYLTASDFVFWWHVPTGQIPNNHFYGKDFVDALNTIKNGAPSSSIRFVRPGTIPADDRYNDDLPSITIYGARLSSFVGLTRICTLSQNQSAINITTPATSVSTLSLSYAQNVQNRTITGLYYAARDQNNALCSFNSAIYALPKTFLKK